MLDEGSGVVGTKREIAAEANVGSDDCAERESNELVFRLCMRVEVIIPVHQMYTGFPWPVFFVRLRGKHSQNSWQER